MKKIALLCVLAAGRASAEDAPPKGWQDQAELTYVNSTGNADVTTFGAANTLTGDWRLWATEIKASVLSSESKGTKTAEQYAASEKLSRNFTKTFYAFEKVGWERNKFAGIHNREDANLGIGAEILKSKTNQLVAELGAGQVWVDPIPGPKDDYPSGRAFSKWTRRLSETASFMQDVEYLHDFSDSENYRVSTESSVTASLSTKLSLKVSYKFKRSNLPPPGARRNDETTSMALVINF